MHISKTIGKREFTQHTSKYIKWVETNDRELVITHQNKPALVLTRVKHKSLETMRGFAEIKVHGDINESVLPGYDEW